MVAPATRHAARLIAAGAALLAGAVLADSSIEHNRGSFGALLLIRRASRG